jgi:hypothetical protein
MHEFAYGGSSVVSYFGAGSLTYIVSARMASKVFRSRPSD